MGEGTYTSVDREDLYETWGRKTIDRSVIPEDLAAETGLASGASHVLIGLDSNFPKLASYKGIQDRLNVNST